MDVDENDLLEYLTDDPDTDVMGLYLESFTDCRRFMALSRSTTKPIVILNGGQTTRGAAAALSHTASLSANGVIVSGAMAQAGVVEADGFYQMTDFCKTLGMYPEIPAKIRNRVAILTYTGAAGIVSADIMDKHGLVLSKLNGDTLKKLQTVFPEWMPPSNPVDMWPGIILNGSKKAYSKAMDAVCADSAVGTLQKTMQSRGSILIQKQVEGKIELAAGFVRDPQLGPCVMCGLGGIFSEALNVTVFGVSPLNLTDALNMISRLKCQDILNRYRGFDPVNREAVGRILVALGDLGSDCSRIQEIDINPLIIDKGFPVAVDALIMLS